MCCETTTRHNKKDCWTQKNNEGDKLEGNKEENVISKKSKEDSLLLSLESVDASWVLNTRDSFHEPCHIVGKGKIKIKLQNGKHWLL